ncbi:MAG: hypothetical protein ACR2KV_03495 [Solirubrobacteraceae bacterium]
MRNRQIPPEAQLYSAAFDAYLRAAPDGRQEEEAADRMATTLSVLAEARLSREPVRAFMGMDKGDQTATQAIRSGPVFGPRAIRSGRSSAPGR